MGLDGEFTSGKAIRGSCFIGTRTRGAFLDIITIWVNRFSLKLHLQLQVTAMTLLLSLSCWVIKQFFFHISNFHFTLHHKKILIFGGICFHLQLCSNFLDNVFKKVEYFASGKQKLFLSLKHMFI